MFLPKIVNKDNVYHILILGLVLTQLLGLIIPIDLTLLEAVFAIGVSIFGIQKLSKSFQIATIIFFVMGIALLGTAGLSVIKFASAVISMIDIIVLLIVMRLFLVPVSVGNYQSSVEEFMKQHVNGPKQTYSFVMLVTNLLSSILSMGTIAIVLSILGDSIKRQVKDSDRLSSTAVTRAYTMGTLWAPGAATIFLISSVTKVGWTRLFVPCFILGTTGLFLSYLMEHNQAYMKVKPVKNDEIVQLNNQKNPSLLGLVFAVVALLVLSFIFMHNKIASSMDSVTIAGLLIVLFWTLLLGLRKIKQQQTFTADLKKSIVSYWQKGMVGGASLAPFFVGIGTFTYGFEHSTISVSLTKNLSPIFASLGWWLILLIPIIVVFVSLIGIHPLASVALIGKVIMSMNITLSPVLVALGLNIGSVASYMLSPFAVIIMIVATILNVKPTTVSLRWNWKFCISFVIVSLALATLLSLIF
ncbi:hypothetical protein [Companilactobacillus furfuricola]|uniref:hypothetical protein n=1 Tax=Companilactobacillus furfuricola TaxID=1462575 RepID=UPI001FE28BB3|nr:hypothetical protein [Companilactobacillus furfuricola]